MVYVSFSQETLAYLEDLLTKHREDDKQKNALLETTRASILASRTNSVKCCLYDGQPFDTENGVVFRLPNQTKNDGFGFYDYTFCGIPCMKAYAETRNNLSPHLLIWITVYAKRDLKILEDINTAPAQELLSVYRTDGKGISIEKFRECNSYKLTEAIHHVSLNRSFWERQEQKNNPQPFFALIREQEYIAQKLYRHFDDRKVPVAKVAGETRPKAKEDTTLFLLPPPESSVPLADVSLPENIETKHDENSEQENSNNSDDEDMTSQLVYHLEKEETLKELNQLLHVTQHTM